jgi:predicted enzyme related to lactoylglutathione lyase
MTAPRDRTVSRASVFRSISGITEDIDAIADRIKTSGGRLDSEPVDAPWGARYFRLTDPDGFKLAVLKALT